MDYIQVCSSRAKLWKKRRTYQLFDVVVETKAKANFGSDLTQVVEEQAGVYGATAVETSEKNFFGREAKTD